MTFGKEISLSFHPSDELPLLALEAVDFIYPNGTVGVISVDLIVRSGEFVAITGPSGSGKSTLLGILGLLAPPTVGAVRIAGVEPISGAERAVLRGTVLGFVFQQFHLVPHLTAFGNVELALRGRGLSKHDRRDRAAQALEQVGCGHRSFHYAPQLSGGEQQRVAIARAVAPGPSLLLADEPTGNLDSASADQVLRVLRKLNEAGTTVVLITHNADVADFAHRMIQVRDGVVTDGAAATTDTH